LKIDAQGLQSQSVKRYLWLLGYEMAFAEAIAGLAALCLQGYINRRFGDF
jgi:hypothetical protein